MVVVLALVVGSLALWARSPRKVVVPDAALGQRVDELFKSVNKDDSTGCSVGVFKDGATVYERGYGRGNFEYDLPNTAKTAFQIGSMSKQFTGMSVLLLASQGRLSLNDDVRKYIPELPVYDQPITVQQLLWHTSGLRDIYDIMELMDIPPSTLLTETEFIRLISRQHTLNFAPGSSFLYSNTNFGLLGVIVRRASGRSLREYTRANIFQPLGMMSTGFYDRFGLVIKNRAYTYSTAADGTILQQVTRNEVPGWTGLFTTVEDMAKWDQSFDQRKIGGDEIYAQFTAPGKLNNGNGLTYADGLVVDEYRGRKRFTHGGADDGFVSIMFHYPERRFGGAILCNGSKLEPWNMADEIADIYLSDYLVSLQKAESPLGEDQLQKMAGLYEDDANGTVTNVVFKDGNLMLGGQPKLTFHRIEGLKFQVGALPIWMTFVPVDKAFRLRRDVFGTYPAYLNRVEPANSPVDVDRFKGRYRNEDLDQTFSVTAGADGKLTMTSRKGTSGALKPLFANVFQWEASGDKVWFDDEKGQIVRFRLTTDSGRVVRVSFVKVKDREIARP